MAFWGWKPYKPVARRRAEAKQYAARLAKQGQKLHPIEIAGRTIARTFWGKAWCENLESYSDYANRLPRGRTYVRNGSVLDLQISAGTITALVSGSEIYKIKIEIARLGGRDWNKIQSDCSQSIDSLMDLLQGRFSQGVMQRLTRHGDGLFPQPSEIKMKCSCPDWAGLCKHLAAVLYGVGARLDEEPELLFMLRDVDHLELINQAVAGDNLDQALGGDQDSGLAGADLGELFGIDLENAASEAGGQTGPKRRRSKRRGAATKDAATKGEATTGRRTGRKSATKKEASAKKSETSRKKKTPVRKKRAKKAPARKR